MQMKATHHTILARTASVLLTAMVLVPSIRAQEQDALIRTPTSQFQMERKRPGFFKNAEKRTASDQFTYAETLRLKGEGKKAHKAYRNLVHSFHDSPEAPEAQRLYAESLVKKGKLEDAFLEYQYIVKYFPGKVSYEEIVSEQFKIANLVRVKNETGLAMAGASTAKTLPLYRKIVENAPNWERAPEAQFFIGAIHEERNEYPDAIDAYERVMLRYPKSAFVSNAAFHRANCLTAIANKNPRDEARAQHALSSLVSVLRDYPSMPDADQARTARDALKLRLSNMIFDRAVYYDTIAKRPEAAMVAYNDFLGRFPTSEQFDRVQKRVAVLQQQIEEQKKSE
ncbi:MAG: outer membrane protein assembly factor BamD [Candidatus Promineifilaceae bacterium]|jgi:outer membrane protein assembly factor BamD